MDNIESEDQIKCFFCEMFIHCNCPNEKKIRNKYKSCALKQPNQFPHRQLIPIKDEDSKDFYGFADGHICSSKCEKKLVFLFKEYFESLKIKAKSKKNIIPAADDLFEEELEIPIKYYLDMEQKSKECNKKLFELLLTVKTQKEHDLIVQLNSIKHFYESVSVEYFHKILIDGNNFLDATNYGAFIHNVKIDTSKLKFYQEAVPPVNYTTYAIVILRNYRDTIYIAGWSDHPDGIWRRKPNLYLRSNSWALIGKNEIPISNTIRVRIGDDRNISYQQVN